MGGGQPPQLPTFPPTYESVSDRTTPTANAPSCSRRWTDGQGRAQLREEQFVKLV